MDIIVRLREKDNTTKISSEIEYLKFTIIFFYFLPEMDIWFKLLLVASGYKHNTVSLNLLSSLESHPLFCSFFPRVIPL